MNLDSKIQEINDYYDFRRAKRDHRNPSTGAFQAYERSGVVKLNYCIETGDKDACVHIADKTGYLKISQEIDDNGGNSNGIFNNNISVLTNIDTKELENNTFELKDLYGTTLHSFFSSISVDIANFVIDDNEFSFDYVQNKVTQIENGDGIIINPTIKRDIAGNLTATGTINGIFTPNPIILITKIFNAYSE